MDVDINSLAAGVAGRIASADAVTRVAGDEGSAEFESSLVMARALQILQEVQSADRRRRPVRPTFFGMQPFSARGMKGSSACREHS